MRLGRDYIFTQLVADRGLGECLKNLLGKPVWKVIIFDNLFGVKYGAKYIHTSHLSKVRWRFAILFS